MKQWLMAIVVVLITYPLLAQKVKAGQECFPVKNNERLLYDEAEILSTSERQAIETKLDAFAASTSNQIAVVIVPDLCGMDKSQFAIELGEEWGLGHRAEDNGVVMLIKPKTVDSKGQIFIAIGRGLEGAIPDAKTFLIVDNEMLPRFRATDMNGGINAGLDVLMSLAKGDYNIDTYAEKHKSGGSSGAGFLVLFVLLFLGVFLLAKVSQVRRYASLNSIPFWTAWTLLNAASQTHRGFYSDFSRGSGGFGGWTGGGGSSGGGFGGFGGGSFGGGGAGGSW